jgi:UDP-glucose 6-dehydrogenase
MVQERTIVNDIEGLWDTEINLNYRRINIVEKLSETYECDSFVILTEWDKFKLIDVEESKIIFDGRNINQNKNKISIGK